jgi:AcrR family transcriptional regulator
VLREAIFAATLAELSEVGYAKLSMEQVAARAQTSKSTLYHRWTGRVELVVDAIGHTLPTFAPPADTGELRADLRAVLAQIADQMCGPTGEAVRGLFVEAFRDPELMAVIRAHFDDPVEPLMFEVLRRGAVRGEVRPGALTPRIARVGPELLRQHVLVHGAPVADAVIIEIVDEVLVPLIRAHP